MARSAPPDADRSRLEEAKWACSQPPCSASRPPQPTPRCNGMGTLIYATNVSLDGYIEDAHGAFDWAPPDDEVFAATTALLRPVGTFLYGRRLYETMAHWETNPALAEQSDLTADFASAWRAADKVVYSTTLTAVPTATTRSRTTLRPRCRPRTEGRKHQQPHHRRGEPRCAGLRCRPGRRVPAVRVAHDPRRRKAGPPGGRPHRPRASQRTPIRQRRRTPSLPRPNLTTRTVFGGGAHGRAHLGPADIGPGA